MRKWVKVTLSLAAVGLLGFMILAGVGTYYVFRHFDSRNATEAETKPDFDAVRAKFPGRQPLVEIRNLQSADVMVHRTTHPSGVRAKTVHILAWNEEDLELVRTDVPVWLMKFSSINVLSHLGIAPEKFRLTADDLERYGPGIVVDFKKPGNQVLVWLE
jgi:hypothetical protein